MVRSTHLGPRHQKVVERSGKKKDRTTRHISVPCRLGRKVTLTRDSYKTVEITPAIYAQDDAFTPHLNIVYPSKYVTRKWLLIFLKWSYMLPSFFLLLFSILFCFYFLFCSCGNLPSFNVYHLGSQLFDLCSQSPSSNFSSYLKWAPHEAL